ncbi:MAG TPA: hypothetical protein VIJ65_06410 [Acidobacteriaceae bacterium]
MRVLHKPHPLAMFSTWFLVVFLVLFPKGGIKIGPLPVTWGYLFLAFSLLPLAIVRLLAFPLRWPKRVLFALALLMPIQLLFLYAAVFYGVADPSFAFSTVVGLFVLPWIFLLVYPAFLSLIDGDRLSLYLRWSMLLAALWGIFLYFLHPLTGHFVEIPYLTVNAGDYGDIEATKHIARGLFMKLISTYNNGNVYGVATLILLPLYRELEHVRWRRIALLIALLLTLSRTVWVGLVLLEIFPLIALLTWQVWTFPILHLRTAVRRIEVATVTIVLVFGALLFNSLGSGALRFLFDPTAGGRINEIKVVISSRITLLPSQPVSGFLEILYSSAAQGYGWMGLVALVLLLVSPILLLVVQPEALHSRIRRAALQGLILYIVLAGMDGALNYIPVMAFYWFAYMVYLFGWPGRPHGVPASHVAHVAEAPAGAASIERVGA